MSQVAVYGIDVGVYRAGKRGQPLANSSFAWARVPPRAKPNYGNISSLIDSMQHDLDSNARIAVGMEAPMWIPLANSSPDRAAGLQDLSNNVFQDRFRREARHRWHLQAGAGAACKAVSLGCFIFSNLGKNARLRLTTSPYRWRGGHSILCYEGFAAGAYRASSSRKGNRRRQDHFNDARAIALAFFYLQPGLRRSALKTKPETLHECGKRPSAASLWSLIAGVCNLRFEGPADCWVVGAKRGFLTQFPKVSTKL